MAQANGHPPFFPHLGPGPVMETAVTLTRSGPCLALVRHAANCSNDITRRESAAFQGKEPKVSSSDARNPDFQKIFESLPNQYIIVTPDRTIVAATDTFLASTGKSREAIVGMDILDAFPDNPDNPDAKGTEILRGSIERVVETGKIDVLPPVRYDIENADGIFEPRWFQPLNAPAFDDDGKLVYVLHGAEDITAQMTSKS